MANTAPAKKAPGRPKKVESETVAPVAKSVDYIAKQVINPQTTKFYEIVKGGGIICRIKSEVTVYDPKEKVTIALRYCPNERTIVRDEQSQYARREHIVFNDKMLAVDFTNPNLIEFLDRHPDNVANGGSIFKEIDKAKTAEEELDREFATHEAVAMIREKSIEELLPVAISLGISTKQKNVEIKREMLKDAKANPTKFISMFDNPMVKCRSAVMQAIDFQIIKSSKGGLNWFDSNRQIITTPPGADTVDIAVRYFMTEKGATVYDQILSELDKI
jgi:hypothetical protein